MSLSPKTPSRRGTETAPPARAAAASAQAESPRRREPGTTASREIRTEFVPEIPAPKRRIKSSDQKKIQQQRPEGGQHKDLAGVQHRTDRTNQADEERIRHQKRQNRERQLYAPARQHRRQPAERLLSGKFTQPDRTTPRPTATINARISDSTEKTMPSSRRTCSGPAFPHRSRRRAESSAVPSAPSPEQPPERVRNRERQSPRARHGVAAEHHAPRASPRTRPSSRDSSVARETSERTLQNAVTRDVNS